MCKYNYKKENKEYFSISTLTSEGFFSSLWRERCHVRSSASWRFSSFSLSLLLQEPVKVFCDDASVEKAVHSAVEKLNERLTTGKKLALFQIQSASKVPEFSTRNWFLQLLLPVFQLTKGTWLMKLQELKLCNDYWEILARHVWILWPFSTHRWCVCGVSAVRIWHRCGVYTAVHQQEDWLPSREQ